jgi:hypothetical protein
MSAAWAASKSVAPAGSSTALASGSNVTRKRGMASAAACSFSRRFCRFSINQIGQAERFLQYSSGSRH